MKKRNKIILISLCLILAICAASTAGVLIWRNTAEKTPVSEEVLVDGGEASVSDEAVLRELLLKEEELVITLAEDITVDESLVVKGKKTLSGTGSIKMALYVMPYESLITVAENASLILDGVTVNGNGIANGVKVEKSANLTFLSGEVAWGNPYGIEVQGSAEIKGGTITDAIHTGIFIGTSGNVQMSAGNVKAAGYASTRISKGGYFGFSGDAILQNCGVYHIHNAGTCDVTGGVVRDSEYTLATTEGDLNIHYQGTDGGMIEWYNATGSGIWVGEGGNLNASGFYVHDVGYAGVNSGQGTGAIKMSNCKFENTGNNGLHIKMATAELKDIEIIKPGKHGVFVNSPTTTATIENLTVTEPAERGLHNAGGTVTAKNVTVASPGTYGVSTGNSGNTAGSVIVENLTITGAGSNPDNSQPAVNSYKSSLTVIDATITDSNNAGARVTDGGELTLKNVKIENTKSYGVYVVHNKSKATLENVSVANTGKHGVYVNNAGAKADISKLTVTNAGERGIHNAGGTITAKNVTINGSGLYGVSTGNHTDSKTGKSTAGSVTIDNLTVTGAKGDAAVNSYKSVLTITNGKINDSAKVGARVTDGGTLKLTDVEITKTGYEGVLVSSEGKATLKNIVVTNAGKHGVYTYKANSKADIDTLTVIGPAERGLHNAGGTITAKNVTITNSGLYGVSTGNFTDAEGKVTAGSVTVDNLTVTGAKGDSAVNSYKSVLKVTNAKIKDSAKIGARVTDGGTLKLTDVEISNTGAGSEGVLINSKGQATLKNVTVTNVGKHGVYVNGVDSKADIDTLKVTEPAERGMHNAGGTITAKNVTITSPGTYGVSTGNSGESKGSVKVTNLTVTNAGAIPTVNEDGSKTIQPAVNSYNSVLTVVDAKLIDSSGVGARATDGGELNLTNVEIEKTGQDGIYASKQGQINISGINTITDAGKDGICANGAGTVVNINTHEGATTKTDALTIITPAQRGIRNEGATVKAANVTVTDPGTYGVSTAKSGESAGSVEVNNLIVTGAGQTEKQPAVNAHNGSIMTVNGAKISDCKNAGARATQGATIVLNDVTMTDMGSHGVYVEGVDSKAFIDTLTILKTEDAAYSVVRGIYNVGGTVEAEHVSVDTPKEYGVSTLAYTDEESGVVTNGSMLVEDLTVTKSQGNASVYANNSVLTVNEGTLSDSKKDGALVNNGGTLNLTDVEIINAVRHGVLVDINSEAYIDDITIITADEFEYTLDSKIDYGDIRVNSGGYAKVTGANIKGSKEYGVYSTGSGAVVDISGLIIEKTSADSSRKSTAMDGIRALSKGTVNLSGINSISDTGRHGINAYQTDAKVNINTQEGATVETDYLTIARTAERGICNEGGTIVAKNVKVDSSGNYAVSTAKNSSAGSVLIDNLTVINASASNSYSNPALNAYDSSVMTINGATISESNGMGARSDKNATLNLVDVTIDTTESYGVCVQNNATLNLSGKSSITNAKTYGIYVKGTSIVNINAEKNESTEEYIALDETKNNLTIAGGTYGIFNESGTVTAYHVAVKDVSTYGVYAKNTNSSVKIDNLKVVKDKADYSSQRGLVSEEGATIVASGIEIDSAKKYSVSAMKSSSMTIDDLTVTNSQETSVHVNESTLTINGAELTGFANYGAVVFTGGILNLNDAVINAAGTSNTGKYGIYLESVYPDKISTLSMNGTNSIANATKAGVYVQPNTVANINNTSGTLTITDCENGIHNIGGTTNAKNVVINTPNVYGVLAEAYVDEDTKAVTKGTATITGLTVNGANINVNDDTEDDDAAVFVNNSVLTVAGTETVATIIDSANTGAGVIGGGILNLTNVAITNAGKHGVYVGTNSTANINVTEGENTDILAITDCAERGIYNVGGTITANNVTVSSSGKYAVSLGSKATGTITNLTVSGTDANAGVMSNDSTLTINGATISNTKTDGAVAAGGGVLYLTAADISNAGRHGVLVEADSEAYVTNLTVITTEDNLYTLDSTIDYGDVRVQGGGYVNVAGANIRGSKEYGVYSTGSGSVADISGLTVEKTSADSSRKSTAVDGIRALSEGTVNLSGINSISDTGRHGINAYRTDAKVNINTQEDATVETDYLTITRTAERGIYNQGGTIVAKNVKIDSSGDYAVATAKDVSAGSVTIDNLTVINASASDSYSNPAVNAHDGSVMTINGALISGGKNAGARVTSGATLNLTDVTINEAGNYGVYVNNAGSVANINGLTINTVKANDGIRVLNGATLNLSGVSSITGAKVHGVYVQANSTANINVEGEVSKNNLTITDCGERGLYNVGGSLTAKNVTVNSSGKYAVSLGKDSTTGKRASATITNLTINGTDANSGVMAHNSDLTINGGTISKAKANGAVAASGGTLKLINVSISDTTGNSVQAEKDSSVTLENVTLSNCTGSHIYKKDNGEITGTYTIAD